MDEYYGWMFENSVPGLPEAAAAEGLTPLAYMRKYGAFKVKDNVYAPYEKPLAADALAGTAIDDDDSEVVLKDGMPVGVLVDGVAAAGFTTPSRRLEFYRADARRLGLARARGAALRAGARALARLCEREERRVRSAAELPAADAGAHALAGEVALRDLARQPAVDRDRGRARATASRPGDLVKVRTRIGYFVTRAWVTEGIRPGVLGMSHHLGRWRLHEELGNRNASALVTIDRQGIGLQGVAGARRAAVRSRPIPTARASGGARSACTRT